MTSDREITAYYTSIPIQYSIHFDLNGGASTEAKDLELGYGDRLGKLPKCTRSGYEFRGWYTDPKVGEEVTASTQVEKDMVIYAHWHSLKPEKVTVHLKFKIGKLEPQLSFKTYLGNVSGYELQYSTSKEFTSEDTTILPLKESYKLSKLLAGKIKGKTYYIRARAISYKKDSTGNYVYGDWGNVVKL